VTGRASVKPAKARVDGQGRILIPAEYRRTLGIREGDLVTLLIEDGVLQVITVSEGIRRAQAIMRQYVPAGVSLVDDLLADRRAEAARE
jgi:AbrB family looped-hinge helix DNA binding protein